MTTIRIISIALVVLAVAAGGARADEAALIIAVEDGSASVTSEGANFTERELRALRTRVQERAADSPLHRAGALRLVLRGQTLAELQSHLRSADLDDPRDVERATDRFLEAYFEHAELSEPIEWVIGREFRRAEHAIGGSVVAIGSNVVIDGAIADIVAVGSRVELGPHAEVSNRLASIGSQVEQAAGARLRGQEMRLAFPADLSDWASSREPAPLGLGARIAWTTAGLVLSFAFGLLYLRIAPVFSARTLESMRSAPWPSFGFGCLHVLGIVPGAVLLALTIVGIALLPVYFLAVAGVVWLAYVASALRLGSASAPRWVRWQQLLLGLVILFAVGWIPGAGGIVTMAAMVFGTGAVMQTLYGRIRARRRRHAAPSLAVPTSEPMHDHPAPHGTV